VLYARTSTYRNEVKFFASTLQNQKSPSKKCANAYTYGFNGKENDDEVKGIKGSQQDYGMRIYDPRLGRFLSIDPISKKFAYFSPYQFAGNTPIKAIDLDGAEIKNVYYNYDDRGYKTTLKNPDDKEVAEKIDKEIAAFQHDDQVLFDYINNNYTVNVSNGKIKNKSEGYDNVGTEQTLSSSTTVTSPTYHTAAQKYDAQHGSGAFKQLMETNYDEAQKIHADFLLNPGPEPPVTITTLSANIVIDTKKISVINREVVAGERDLSASIQTGRVLKHEIGHFLFSILKSLNKANPTQTSEDKALEVEKTFDTDPNTQTKPEDLPK